MSSIPVFKFALREDVKNMKEFLPTRAEPKATGWDVRNCSFNHKSITLRAGQKFTIPLGFRALPPDGWWFSLNPRSSAFIKKGMHCLVGIIDESFPLEVCLAGTFLPDISSMSTDLTIEFGERIAQIIPVRRKEMVIEEVTNEEYSMIRKEQDNIRIGGTGSTGSK